MSSTESKADCGSAAKGAARRTRASSSSTSQLSSAVIATNCWASTSSGLRGTRRASICPDRIRSVTTADCTRSARNLGKTTPVETAPTWWPARPTRCRPEATEGGDSTWITRSTAPMSMPSSRLEVATTAGSRPALSSSSTRARCSLETEPWWARASTGGAPLATPDWAISWAGAWCSGSAVAEPSASGAPAARSRAISFSRLQSRSASRRELTKTMVERCAWTRSTIRSSTCGQIEAFFAGSSAAGAGESSARSATGTTTERSKRLVEGGWTMVAPRRGLRNRATSSTGRTVALRPIRRAGRSSSSSSRSRLSARWAPRLVPATACTSSRITVSMPRSASREAEVSSRKSDSGVVIRMSGGWLWKRRRSAAGVSPERMPTCTSGSGRPSRTAAWRSPVSGARRLRSTSTARAFSGEM